jgi:hypothetical protein
MVLVINNSIQENTGIVVGLTFALANALLVGKTALISGIAATLAMVASEYLSQKAESADASAPRKAAMYTGAIYLFVVAVVVTPFFFRILAPLRGARRGHRRGGVHRRRLYVLYVGGQKPRLQEGARGGVSYHRGSCSPVARGGNGYEDGFWRLKIKDDG